MNISEFAKLFPEKMREVTHYLEGDGVKSDIGRVALEHVERNFEQEGYVDEALNPWKEVERRKPDSSWYGHSGQLGKPSSERKEAPILHGETRELSRATRMELTPEGVRLINSTPYAQCISSACLPRFTARSPLRCPNAPLWDAPK